MYVRLLVNHLSRESKSLLTIRVSLTRGTRNAQSLRHASAESRKPNGSNVNVTGAMSRSVKFTGPDVCVRDAAAQMALAGVGFLPVVESGRLVGAVTDRDLVVRGTAKGFDPAVTPVRAVMSPRVFTCYENQPVQEAEAIMQHRAVRRLPVLSRAGALVGVVSLADFAAWPADGVRVAHVLDGITKSQRNSARV